MVLPARQTQMAHTRELLPGYHTDSRRVRQARRVRGLSAGRLAVGVGGLLLWSRAHKPKSLGRAGAPVPLGPRIRFSRGPGWTETSL